MFGLSNSLASRTGVELKVLTSDSAGPRLSQKIPYSSYPVTYSPGYSVYFCRRRLGATFAPRMFTELPRLISWASVVHVTAAYSPPTIPALALCRALDTPVVWSPRGAFLEWHSRTHPVLKSAWENICGSLLAAARTIIHVTSCEEAKATRQRIPGIRVEVIPNGVDLPADLPQRAWKPNDRLRLLYLGRLHPIKGIENLLRALASVPGLSVTLRICGSGEPEYVASLRRLVASLDIGELVSFAGEIGPQEKADTFSSADVCVVPSHSENFGMVVAEALAHAVPVIASRGTPWAGVEQHACGLWTDNRPDALAAAIQDLAQRDLAAMGQRGRSWMAREYRWDTVASRMMDCYASLTTNA